MAKSVYQQVHEAIDKYERDIADGTLTFEDGDFCDEPADRQGGWIQSHLADHLPEFDLTAAGGAR